VMARGKMYKSYEYICECDSLVGKQMRNVRPSLLFSSHSSSFKTRTPSVTVILLVFQKTTLQRLTFARRELVSFLLSDINTTYSYIYISAEHLAYVLN
jgi:hypothetical protein